MPMVPVTDPPAGVVVDNDASDNTTVTPMGYLDLKRRLFIDLSDNQHGTGFHVTYKKGSKVPDDLVQALEFDLALDDDLVQALEFDRGYLDKMMWLDFYTSQQALEFDRGYLDEMMWLDFYPTLGRSCKGLLGRSRKEAGWVFDVKKHSAKPCKGEAYALATTPSPTPDHGNQTPVLWLDSGATHHVVFDDKLLTNLRAPPTGNAVTVTVADGFKLPVVKIGDIRTAQIQIKDVYLVPGLQMNLVSVRQLTRSQIFTTFYENHAELWRGGEQVGGAITDNDTSLYRLRFLTEI